MSATASETTSSNQPVVPVADAAAPDLVERLQSQLADRDQELADLGYAISHDLNEPIRKLMSFSSLLVEDMEQEELNEQASKDLQFVVDAAERMRDLVAGLSSWSRACRRAMQHQPVCLETCSQRAISHLKEVVDQCQPEIGSDPLPTVQGDLEMLVGLYEHLLDNALKFRGQQTLQIQLTAREQDDHWLLGVRDNGIGIDDKHLEQIFRPLQRLHRRGTYSGTGVGLSISRKIVQRHGGRLWCESTPGEGSHFQFTLPKFSETETRS